MRVWYVFPRFPAPSETFAGTDLRLLRELGVEVRAVNLRSLGLPALALLEQWGLEGIKIDKSGASKLLSGCGWMLRRSGLALQALWTILRDNWRSPIHILKSVLVLPRTFSVHRTLAAAPPDVLHLFWGHYASILGLLVRRTHPRVVVTVFLGAYDLRSRYRTSATLARQANRVFTHARANLELLGREGIRGERVVVTYRGVDLERLSYTPRAKIAFRIASAGRLIREKGFDTVIRAFAQIRESYPSSTLVIMGEGPARPELERLVSERRLTGIEFTGHLPHREVFERMCEAEVFLFLSRKEHLPNVVKEAIAARCACVVSRTTGIEELIAPRRHGLLVGQDDPQAAADAVGEFFREPEFRERCVREALVHLESSFDGRRTMQRYVEAWAACLRELGTRARPGDTATSTGD